MEQLSNICFREDEDDYVYVFAEVARGGIRGYAGTDEEKTSHTATGGRNRLFSEAMRVVIGHVFVHNKRLYPSFSGLQMVSSDLREAYHSTAAMRTQVSAGVRFSGRGNLSPWDT